MTSALLTTKLNLPRPRPHRVPRPALTARLDEGLRLGHRLALISAPAGFGKTTLVSEWMHQVRAQHAAPLRVAWLSLDEGDGDPARFLTYLIAALRTLEPGLGRGTLSALQSPQPPKAEAVLTPLINELAALPGRIVLVLDDYHLAEARAVHETVAFVLARLPRQLHLVIATRQDPHLPLARLRARGQLTELRAADLRFSRAEAAEFLNQVMGLGLSAEDIAALEARTEGWIAGLQLAALSMHGHHDTRHFVDSFTGSHRFVLDYLIEEVLDRQTPSVQAFLLQTAILDSLSGPLCDAVRAAVTATGWDAAVRLDSGLHGSQDDGQSILEWLEHANLFIVPLDEERGWYRYHHLFVDLLRRRLHQLHPDWLPALHRGACAWYEENGPADEAIDHALRAGDVERAAGLMEEHADAAWRSGEHTKLRLWLDALAVEGIRAKPVLCIYHAWYLFTAGQQDAAEAALQACERALGGAPDALPDAGRQALVGRAAVIRAFFATYVGDIPAIIRHARQALDSLPLGDVSWRRDAALALGDAQGFKGDMDAAYRARLQAAEASRSPDDTIFSLLAYLKVAITLREQGQLQRTIALCRQQIAVAGKSGLSRAPVPGGFQAIWGEVLAEMGDLDGALDLATRGVELTERGGESLVAGWGYLCLARVLVSRGDFAGAEAIARKVEKAARRSRVPPWVATEMAAWRARLWLAQGKLEAASRWARRRGLLAEGEPAPVPDLDFFPVNDFVVVARILLAREQWDSAGRLLARLLKAAEAGGRTSKAIEILSLQALAAGAKGDTSLALASIGKALTLAEPEGFVQTFLDEGPPMDRLLQEAAARGTAPGYARKLIAAFPIGQAKAGAVSAARPPAQGRGPELVEPLSDRELEVLQRIAEGLTNREVADRLFLSLNTVKAHTRNIYGKLDVHSRTQAVARARALGVLSST